MSVIMDFICPTFRALLDVAPILTAFVALAALFLSWRTANKQIKLQEQEWLPYLSYEKMNGGLVQGVIGLKPELVMNPAFSMVLKNNGRCIVQYEIKKFDVTLIIHYTELEEASLQKDENASARRFVSARKKHPPLTPKRMQNSSQTKGVVGINSELVQSCGAYQFLPEEANVNLDEATFQFQVDFVVEYGKKGAAKNEYSLKYVVDMIYDHENKKFIESISMADIEGY